MSPASPAMYRGLLLLPALFFAPSLYAEQLFGQTAPDPLYRPSSLTLGMGSESSGYSDLSVGVSHGLSRESRLFGGVGQSTYSDALTETTQDSYFLGFGATPINSVDMNMEYSYWDQEGLLTSDAIKGAVQWISPQFSLGVFPELRYISMDSSLSATGDRIGIRNPGLGFQGRLYAARELSFAFSRYTYTYSNDQDLLQQVPRRASPYGSHLTEQFDKRRTTLSASYQVQALSLSLEWLEGIAAADSSLYNSLSTILLWDLDRSWGVQVRLGETTYDDTQESATYGNFGFNYRW